MSLAHAYLSWCSLEAIADVDSPEHRAWTEMHELLEADPPSASAVLLEVIKFAPDDETTLVSLGADALEDLLRLDPATWVPRFSAEALRDARAAVAMSAVWMDEPWRTTLAALRKRTEQPKRG